MSLLVGGNHIAFYRQFAAAGLHTTMQIVSPTFGLGNEQVVLSPEEAEGIVVIYPYFQELNNPTNRAWVQAWHDRHGADYTYITNYARTVWNGWHLWAMAANQAGSLEREAVTEVLESGLTFDSPKGRSSSIPRATTSCTPCTWRGSTASGASRLFRLSRIWSRATPRTCAI